MVWESDGRGDAKVYHELSEYTLPTSGRAVVVHLSDGTRAGCGVLKGAASATIGAYPGYTGSYMVGRTVVVHLSDGTRAGCGVLSGNAIVGCGAVYGAKSGSGGADEGLDAGAIVGIILAIGVILACGVAFFFCRGETRSFEVEEARARAELEKQ